MRWIKLWPDEWLNGTLRFTTSHRERSVWADLLALGGRSRIPGVVCAGEESGKLVGYPIEHLAGIAMVPPEEFSQMLALFESQGRIMVERENGRLIIRLSNWSKYQVEYSRQSRYKAKQKRLRQQATPKGDAKGDGEVEGEGEGEGDKNPAAKTTPLADPRHKTFFDSAYEAYRQKHGQPPTWGGKEAKALQAFLRTHRHITEEEWRRRFGHFLNSTDTFVLKQGCSLAYFVGHFDSFRDGPILERRSDAHETKKLDGDDRTRHNLRVLQSAS